MKINEIQWKSMKNQLKSKKPEQRGNGRREDGATDHSRTPGEAKSCTGFGAVAIGFGLLLHVQVWADHRFGSRSPRLAGTPLREQITVRSKAIAVAVAADDAPADSSETTLWRAGEAGDPQRSGAQAKHDRQWTGGAKVGQPGVA